MRRFTTAGRFGLRVKGDELMTQHSEGRSGKSGPKMNAQIHDGRRFGLRMMGDELMTEHSGGSGQARADQR